MAVGPFNESHLYLQWGGILAGGESWSNGLRLKPMNGIVNWPADQTAMITACKTAIQAFHSRPGSHISGDAGLSFVKLNAIGTNGRYLADTTTGQVLADIPGADGGAKYPYQVALACTLLTGFSRGTAAKGRIYLPTPNVGVSSGLIVSPGAADVKTSLTTLFTALNAVNANYKIAVYSRKLSGPGNRVATGWAVGQVLDTMRSRRRSLKEAPYA